MEKRDILIALGFLAWLAFLYHYVGYGSLVIGFTVLGGFIGWQVWPRLLKPRLAYVLEVSESFVVAVYEFPKRELKEWKLEGDLRGLFRSKSGETLIIADKVDFKNKVIHLAWSHQLSNLAFLAHARSFKLAKELAGRYADELANYKLLISKLVRILRHELISDLTKPVTAHIKELEVRPEEREELGAIVPAQAGGEGGEQEGEAPAT